MVFLLGLQEQQSNHIFLRKFSSINIPSIHEVLSEINFEEISSLTKTIPCSFLSLQKGAVNPGILNWPTGNDSSSLVTDMTKMSTFPLI